MNIFYFFAGIAFSLEIESAIDLTGETISSATSLISAFESLDATSAAVTEIGNMLFRNSPRISSVVFTSSQIATLGDDLFEVLATGFKILKIVKGSRSGL